MVQPDARVSPDGSLARVSGPRRDAAAVMPTDSSAPKEQQT
jgi:hypothetical protein